MVRVRFTLVGHVPDIWREVSVDDRLSLAELRRVVHTVFEGVHCEHHAFTEAVDGAVWQPRRRRWGDRWTMIDLRDPTVVDEDTVTVGEVLTSDGPLALVHTCNHEEQVIIEPCGREMTFASSPAATLVSGARARPFPCCRSPYEHEAMVGILDDPEHVAHDRLRRAVDDVVGPWGRFDAGEFDLEATRRALARLPLLPRPGDRRVADLSETSHLAWLGQSLPRTARASFDRHVASLGLEVPAVVTSQDASGATRGLRWVIHRAATDELTLLQDGSPHPMALSEGAEALACEPDEVDRLIDLARRHHLIYRRSGRFRANKRALAAADDPVALWSLLAREVGESSRRHAARQLLLLGVVDGSLEHPARGVAHCVEARGLIDNRGFDWNRGYFGEYGDEYGGHKADECGQRCDCPARGGHSWHDITARAIRVAITEAAAPTARALVHSYPDAASADLGFAEDWLYQPTHTPAPEASVSSDPPAAESRYLGEVADLVEVLSCFGLQRTGSGGWSATAVTREFARACLQNTSHRYGMF